MSELSTVPVCIGCRHIWTAASQIPSTVFQHLAQTYNSYIDLSEGTCKLHTTLKSEGCVRMGIECKYISVHREQGQPAATFSVTPISAANGRSRSTPASPLSLPTMQAPAPAPSNAPPMRRYPAPTFVVPHKPGHDNTARAAPA
ncbi:hypothetical protein GGX14DRAFT_398492 [Mycena pura]|uniref:Uncharacterized protein n=1 Tax=Mycena pura TaxID=153505 RepID=A0AAD6VAP5_9AGAR|nr:hypothetical protein GGX14DRAFT_398492 [Mycena pura]